MRLVILLANGFELSGPAWLLSTGNRALAGSAAARDCVKSPVLYMVDQPTSVVHGETIDGSHPRDRPRPTDLVP